MSLYDILSEAPQLEDVIPESCLSFSEQAIYVVEFAKQEHNLLMTNIGINELCVFESTGNGIIYEGEEKEKLEKKEAKYKVRVFGAMKKFFSNAHTTFQAKIKDANKVMSRIDQDTIKNIPEDFSATTHEFFDFKKVKFMENSFKFAKEIDKTFMQLAKAGASKEQIKDAQNMLVNKETKAILGENASDVFHNTKEMKKFLKPELMGKEVPVNKAWVKKNFNAMKNVLVGDHIPKAVAQVYKDQKKCLDSIFDTYSKYGKESEYESVSIAWESTLCDVCFVAFMGYAIAFDVYKRMHKEYMTIAIKIAKYSNKPVKEDASEGAIEDKNSEELRDGSTKTNEDPEGTVKDADKEFESIEGMENRIPNAAGSAEDKAHDVTKEIEDALSESAFNNSAEFSLIDKAFDF